MSPAPPASVQVADEPAPRYLRFMTALVLGTALAVVPALTGCDDDDDAPPADARMADADVPDADGVVDGPLAPPDLPHQA